MTSNAPSLILASMIAAVGLLGMSVGFGPTVDARPAAAVTPEVNQQSADSPLIERVQPWLNVAEARFSGARSVAGPPAGVAFSLDMGTTRQNWTHNRWSVMMLPEPMDISEFDGLLIEVTGDQPRRDTGVYVALREADGTWYSHPWAVHLASRGSNHGIARFADFTLPQFHNPPQGSFVDNNDRFDLDGITGIAIGVVNPLGIGKVDFTLRRMDLVKLRSAPQPAADRVSVTGKLIQINSTDAVPSGLFGGFHLGTNRHARFRLAANRTIHHDATGGNAVLGGPMTPMHINTVGDRVRPSPRLTRANWEELSRAVGRRMGEQAKEAGRPLFVEYYNEPYLNWANHNRANFIPRFFDESRATEGGPVHIRHDGAVAPHLIWTRDRKHFLPSIFGIYDRRFGANLDHWRRGRTEDGRVLSVHAEPYAGDMGRLYYGGQWLPRSHPPRDVADGETYTFNNQTLTAFTPWHVIDTTQFTYWSGKGMLKFYVDPMRAVGEALKEANPDAVYIVGWGNRPSEDHWAGFHQLYKPTIDAGIDLIDGYNEHDYGGDPTNMAANYEVVTAYGVIEHGKWLYAFNTETASSSDPQAFRDAPQNSADIAKFTWFTRKMMHALDYVPDKARVFLHFGDGQATSRGGSGWWSDKGEGVSAEMMINVRGRMVQAINDSPDLYVVASIDGTDPFAPRPDFLPDRQEMVVALFNDRHESRQVELDIHAPEGTQLQQGTQRFSRFVDRDVAVATAPVAVRDGRLVQTRIEMAPRELRIITLPLVNRADPEKAWEAPEPTIVRKQFFGKTILKAVEPGSPVTETIEVDADLLGGVQRAWLGLVVQRLGHGDGVIELNGRRIVLPAAVTAENNARIIRVPIDPQMLQGENRLVIQAGNDARAGFFLGMSSIWVESERR